MADAAKANAELFERFYSAFARSDAEAMLACCRAARDPVSGSTRAAALDVALATV